jgi:hypothetical protein
MKKIALVLGLVAVFALVNVASAATLAELQAQMAQIQAAIAALGGSSSSVSSAPTITKSLTIGSKGDEVTALQKYLEDEGLLVMPAGVDYGYFGGLTKSAVVAWQKANDVTPASGYFGPLSRAALAALATTSTGGTTGTAVGLDQADGSVTAAISPIVSTSQTLKKGDTKDIYAVKLQAIGGKVAVNRLDINFSVRPWLIASQLTLKDSAGNVLATKALSSAADATEVVAGSDYAVRFDGLNYVVTPGTDGVLVVGITVPASNSFVGTSGYTTIYATVKTTGIRVINGKGYTESVGVQSTVTSGNVLTMSSTGNTADLSITIAPTSPLTGQVNINNSGADTTSVPLAVYRVRSSTQASTLNTLVFNVYTDPIHTVDLTTSAKNFVLTDGTTRYGAASVSGTTAAYAVVTFSSLNIPVGMDAYKDLTLTADITASSSAWAASSTLDVSGTVGTDANYNTPTYGGATMSGVTSDVTGGNLTFTSNALTVTSTSGGISATAIGNGQKATVNYDAAFSITLKNNSVNNLYVSAVTGDMFSTTSLANGSSATDATTTIISVVAADTLNGDTAGTSYIIPAGGTRTFNAAAHIGKNLNTTTSRTLTIASVKYGTASGTYASSVTAGLNSLTKLVSFSGVD